MLDQTSRDYIISQVKAKKTLNLFQEHFLCQTKYKSFFKLVDRTLRDCKITYNILMTIFTILVEDRSKSVLQGVLFSHYHIKKSTFMNKQTTKKFLKLLNLSKKNKLDKKVSGEKQQVQTPNKCYSKDHTRSRSICNEPNDLLKGQNNITVNYIEYLLKIFSMQQLYQVLNSNKLSSLNLKECKLVINLYKKLSSIIQPLMKQMIQETSNYLTFTYELLVEDLKFYAKIRKYIKRQVDNIEFQMHQQDNKSVQHYVHQNACKQLWIEKILDLNNMLNVISELNIQFKKLFHYKHYNFTEGSEPNWIQQKQFALVYQISGLIQLVDDQNSTSTSTLSSPRKKQEEIDNEDNLRIGENKKKESAKKLKKSMTLIEVNSSIQQTKVLILSQKNEQQITTQ